MTNIEQMIQNLCPNGVEFKKLGEVCDMKRGSTITASQAVAGDIPVIAGGQKPAYYHNQSNRQGRNITVAGSGAYAGYVAFWEQPIFVSDAFTVTPKDERLDIKYIYYYLTNKQEEIHHTKKGSGVPHVHPSSIADFEIPLPPLEIQKKIVECLDKFSALAAELQAELQMRRKQYEYYRTQLLTPHSDCNSATKSDDCNWEWKTLGEICDIKVGGEPPKNLSKEKDAQHPYPIYGNGRDVYGYTDSYKIDADAVAISSIGANTGAVFFYPAFFTPIIRLKVLLPKNSDVNIRYLYYACSLIDFKSKKSSVPNMSADDIRIKKVLLPPIKEQNRIVSILDRFEKLLTSMEEGIPAEQAAQQKRYEYYRDLLLTFPRKAV